MGSMYEMIMDLPLFKGISRDQVSTLLERNNIVFDTYRPNDSIAAEGEICRDILFVIKGQVKVKHETDDVTLSYVLSPGSVIGMYTIFGWKPQYDASYKAMGQVSLMRFSKEQYLRLLAIDTIYLINGLNYLSFGVQLSREGVKNFLGSDIVNIMARWLLSFTNQYSNVIVFTLKRMLTEEEDRACDVLAGRNLLRREGNKLIILDKKQLIEFLNQQTISV